MRRFSAVVMITALSCVLATQSASAAPSYRSYTALGDSFATGLGIPPAAGNPLCGRSANNYPALTARALGVQSFTDVSCVSATLENMTAPQVFALQPPQFDALRPDADLVTVTMGINDAGIVPPLVACSIFGALFPAAAPCTLLMNLFGFDYGAALVRQEAPAMVAMLQGIHQRSPHAKVLLVGLPFYVPEVASSCASGVPFAQADLPYVSSLIRAINDVLRSAAASASATYVDTYSSSRGHDMCQPVGTRWIEGLEPGDRAAQMHPNALGVQNMSAAVVAALGLN